MRLVQRLLSLTKHHPLRRLGVTLGNKEDPSKPIVQEPLHTSSKHKQLNHKERSRVNLTTFGLILLFLLISAVLPGPCRLVSSSWIRLDMSFGLLNSVIGYFPITIPLLIFVSYNIAKWRVTKKVGIILYISISILICFPYGLYQLEQNQVKKAVEKKSHLREAMVDCK